MPPIKRQKTDDGTDVAKATVSDVKAGAGSTGAADAAKEARRGNQKAQWQKRKQTYLDAILAANKEIDVGINGAKSGLDDAIDAFFTGYVDVPANIRVKIKKLKEAAAFKLDTMHSRIASFNKILLDYFKKTKTPEIQTAIIRDEKTKGLSLAISGNKKATNKAFVKEFGEGSLAEFYENKLREDLVNQRRATLESAVETIRPEDLLTLPVFGISAEDIQHDQDSDRFVFPGLTTKKKALDDGSDTKAASETEEMSLDAEELNQHLSWSALYHVSRETRRDPRIKELNLARAFVKKPIQIGAEKADLAKVFVPDNEKELHAESAILKALEGLDKTMVLVGGTKVACTSCQAVFTEAKKDDLLGDLTSFAWLSASSMLQLTGDAKAVEAYLGKIRTTLEHRLDKLSFFEGNAGTYFPENLETDSEPEPPSPLPTAKADDMTADGEPDAESTPITKKRKARDDEIALHSEEEDALYEVAGNAMIEEPVFQKVVARFKTRKKPRPSDVAVMDVDD